MTRFIALCAAADLPNGRHRAFEVEGLSILLFHLNGRFHALRNRCTHLDFPLEGGRQTGFEIACRQHGARFDIRDGRALGGPAVTPVQVFEVRVADGQVEVALNAQA